MSHLTVCKTKIQNANPELVKLAMQALAQLHNAQLLENTKVRDLYISFAADYVLKMPNSRYIGVRIQNGELRILGDPYGWRETYERLTQQIQQMYMFYAVTTTMMNMGYKVQNVQMMENGIYGEVELR